MQASYRRAARPTLVQPHGVVPYVTPVFMEVFDSDTAAVHTSPVAHLEGSLFAMTISSSQQDTLAVPPSPPPLSPALSSAAQPLLPPQTEDLMSPVGGKTTLNDNVAGPSTVQHSRADQL